MRSICHLQRRNCERGRRDLRQPNVRNSIREWRNAMHLPTRLEKMIRSNFLSTPLHSFGSCMLTLLCVFGSFVSTARAQNQEFPIYPKYQVMGVVYGTPGAAC